MLIFRSRPSCRKLSVATQEWKGMEYVKVAMVYRFIKGLGTYEYQNKSSLTQIAVLSNKMQPFNKS